MVQLLQKLLQKMLAKLQLHYKKIADITDSAEFVYGDTNISIKEALDAWTSRLESVFPTRSGVAQTELEDTLFDEKNIYISSQKAAKPEVLFQYFQELTVNMIQRRHLKLLGQM